MKAKKFTRETIRDLGIYERPFLNIEVGSTVAVSLRIKEGDKQRIQIFEGDVIGISNNGPSSTFTVRKIGANSIAVERIFPFYSPVIDNIRFVKKGKIRRAKLYYMRDRIGKAARVEEKVLTKEQKARQLLAHTHTVVEPKTQTVVESKASEQE
jgi:large subunit ribosomal protein L19